MLLGRYIPAAVRLHQEGTRYTGEQVQRWLTALADGLAWQARHGRSATDITLHEWRRPPETWTAQISSAALVLFPFLVVSAIDAYVHSALVAFAVFFAAFTLNTSGAFFPRKRSQQHGSRRNERRARLEYGVSNGLAAWIGHVPAHALAHGRAHRRHRVRVHIRSGIRAHDGVLVWGRGRSHGRAYSRTHQRTHKQACKFSPKTRRPHTIVRTNGLVGAVGGLAGGIAIGITFEVTSGIGIGLTNGVIIGFAVWFSISARIWGRYHLVVTWNAIRRKTPLRFGRSSTGPCRPDFCGSPGFPTSFATGSSRTGSRRLETAPDRDNADHHPFCGTRSSHNSGSPSIQPTSWSRPQPNWR